MTDEELEEVRQRDREAVSRLFHSKMTQTERDHLRSDMDRRELLAEVDRLQGMVTRRDEMLEFARERSEQAAEQGARLVARLQGIEAERDRAMECFDRDQRVIADLQAENARLRAQVAAVEAQHSRYGSATQNGFCEHCGQPWPCSTYAALASGDEGTT